MAGIIDGVIEIIIIKRPYGYRYSTKKTILSAKALYT
jgi:hypothetical protein